MGNWLKFITLLIGIFVSLYSSFQLWQWREIFFVTLSDDKKASDHSERSTSSHEKPASEHAAAPAGGGGHDAKPSEHGGGGHDDKKDKGAIGSVISLDEVFITLPSEGDKSHTVSFQLEIELFSADQRQKIEKNLSVIRDIVLTRTSEQNYQRLSHLSGKLFLKEELVSEINQKFQVALVREIHFNTFFLR